MGLTSVVATTQTMVLAKTAAIGKIIPPKIIMPMIIPPEVRQDMATRGWPRGRQDPREYAHKPQKGLTIPAVWLYSARVQAKGFPFVHLLY